MGRCGAGDIGGGDWWGGAIWSKIIDARSKREDRQNAHALDYEGWVWHAKNDALRRLISACRLVKHWAAQQPDAEPDKPAWRLKLIRVLDEFTRGIGDEEGISEITAYAAEPVRDALDEMLELIDERVGPHQVSLSMLKDADTQLERLRRSPSKEDDQEEWDLLQTKRAAQIKRIGTADIDADAVIKLCDRIIDVARADRFRNIGSRVGRQGCPRVGPARESVVPGEQWRRGVQCR
jgi:hypothetical protein